MYAQIRCNILKYIKRYKQKKIHIFYYMYIYKVPYLKSNMIQIFTHAGNVLVQAQETNEILTNVYDSGYPFVTWHGCINFLGGAKGKEDECPKHLNIRELEEEF